MFYFSYFFLKICVSSSLGRCYFRILFHVLIVNFISLAGVNLFLVLQQYGLILFCFDIFPPITVICSRSVFFLLLLHLVVVLFLTALKLLSQLVVVLFCLVYIFVPPVDKVRSLDATIWSLWMSTMFHIH
jgi:hypothetical protein